MSPRGFRDEDTKPPDDSPEIEPWSLEAFTAGHAPQLAFCRDRAQWIHVMCARQSGKTWGDDGILFDNAKAAPRSTNLLLGLKGTGVKFSNWQPIWIPLCDRFGVPMGAHNNTSMLTTLENDSRIMFAGTDDLANVKKYLGNRLDNGVVIIDEAQSQPDTVLKYLLTNLLPPMMTPTTRVILSGVLPDLPTGYFFDLATDRELADAPELQDSKGWSHHEWGRAANIHTPEAMEQLRAYMAKHSIAENDPQILRDWYMRRVWDQSTAAYFYDRERNGYEATEPDWLHDARLWLGLPTSPGGTLHAARPWPGIEIFSIALDPGGSQDRAAIEVNGWGQGSPYVQHVFDWCSRKAARLTWDQMGQILQLVKQHFGGTFWFYDSGSSQNELDIFTRLYGIPVIKCADKADMAGQIRLCNTLLRAGTHKIMIGSPLEEDMRKAKLDQDAARERRWKWDSAWHPDPAEASRYSLQPYFNIYTPPDDRSPEQMRRALEEERIREAMQIASANRSGHAPQDDLRRVLGYDN